MTVVKPLNFSVQITAEQDALKVCSFKESFTFTRVGSSDLQTCRTLTDRHKQGERDRQPNML